MNPVLAFIQEILKNLIKVLKELRDLGNTVIVVEHDEDIIRSADHIIDIGPEAGKNGGSVVAEGSLKSLLKSKSLTSQYLVGEKVVNIPLKKRNSLGKILVKGARRK